MGVLEQAIGELDASRAARGREAGGRAARAPRLHGGAGRAGAARCCPARSRPSRTSSPRRSPRPGASPSDERVHQEIVLYAARIDVDEEIARLVTHIAEFRRVLDKGGRLRQAPRLPLPGAEPRGQHARLQVGGQRDDAHLGRAEGADRADARASARTSSERCRGNLFVVVRALGRRQDQPRGRAPRARTRNIRLSISYTTRAPREGEKDGRDYHFVDRAKFEKMIAAGDFLEHANVYGNYYGTSRRWIEQRARRRPRRAAGDRLAGGRAGAQASSRTWSGSSSCRPRSPSCAGACEGRGKDSPETIERRHGERPRRNLACS